MNDINDLKRRAGITETRQKLNENLMVMLHAILDTYAKEMEQGSHETAVNELRAKGIEDKAIAQVAAFYSEVQSKQQVKSGY